MSHEFPPFRMSSHKHLILSIDGRAQKSDAVPMFPRISTCFDEETEGGEAYWCDTCDRAKLGTPEMYSLRLCLECHLKEKKLDGGSSTQASLRAPVNANRLPLPAVQPIQAASEPTPESRGWIRKPGKSSGGETRGFWEQVVGGVRFRMDTSRECLPDEEAENDTHRYDLCRRLHKHLTIKVIHNKCEFFSKAQGAEFEQHGMFWPLRSLKLIPKEK